MRGTTRTFALALGALALAACGPKRIATAPVTAADEAAKAAQAAVNPDAPPAAGGLRAATLVEGTATVTKINQKTRMITLRGADGRVNSFRVDDAVKNLSQVRVGDEVKVAYYESVTVRLRKKGTAVPGVATSDEELVARPGEMPAGISASATTIIARIVDIDRKAQTATLQGPPPESRTVTVKVEDKARLDRAKKGDLVEITLTEALAASVEKIAKKR